MVDIGTALSSSKNQSGKGPDGRNLRAARTRKSILNAARALIREGDFSPTVIEVARNANCSVRSVFQHFGSIGGLYAAVFQDQPALRREVGLMMFKLMNIEAPNPDAAAEVGEQLEPHEKAADFEGRLENVLDRLPQFIANLLKSH